jgi:hypothetical protein
LILEKIADGSPESPISNHSSTILRAGNGTRTRDLLLGKEVFYQLNYARKTGLAQAGSAESQNRTGDTMIFSHVLYQLSYLGLSAVDFFSKAPLILHSCRSIVNRYF